jgi:hypothetical protein
MTVAVVDEDVITELELAMSQTCEIKSSHPEHVPCGRRATWVITGRDVVCGVPITRYACGGCVWAWFMAAQFGGWSTCPNSNVHRGHRGVVEARAL